MSDRHWNCRCGNVRIVVRDVPRSGVPAVCYCSDCRAFARLHGAQGDLDGAGGIGLYSTTPDKVEILSGVVHLTCQKLSSRGPLRWFTSCCDTPLGNGAPIRAVPFFSVLSAPMDGEPLAPQVRLHRRSALGRVPRPHGSTYALVLGVAKRVLAARLSGRWRNNPFFNDTGTPMAKPGHPDPDAKRRAYGDAP